MLRLVLLGSFLIRESFAEFEMLKYDRSFNDALTDEHIWGGYEEEHTKYVKGYSSDRVKQIDGSFFDNQLFSRWTS